MYEGRAAKVILTPATGRSRKYYEECANAGTNEWQIDESKSFTATNVVLGDEDRLKALAEDFANIRKRVASSTVKKAMFVCASRNCSDFTVSLKLFALPGLK
ncbi:MAG: hypothetical protein ACLRP3_12425 [Escherichia sp.]